MSILVKDKRSSLLKGRFTNKKVLQLGSSLFNDDTHNLWMQRCKTSYSRNLRMLIIRQSDLRMLIITQSNLRMLIIRQSNLRMLAIRQSVCPCQFLQARQTNNACQRQTLAYCKQLLITSIKIIIALGPGGANECFQRKPSLSAVIIVFYFQLFF